MGVLTGTAQIPPPIQAVFDRMLLKRANPKLVHGMVAQRKSISQRSGSSMLFRRIPKLPLATTPLAEGMPPAGRRLSKQDIQATLQQYGDYVTLTDLVQATVHHPVLRDANKVLGEQMGETMDALDRDVWAAGTAVFRGGNAALRTDLLGEVHKLDTAVLDRAIRLLLSNNVDFFTEFVSSSTKQATWPIRPAFWAITSPEVLFTLENLPGFIAVEHYKGQAKVHDAEVGSYKSIRFLVTTQAKTWLGGGGTASGDVQKTGDDADVHSILIFSPDAVAQVPLEGASVKNIIKPLGAAGTGDPLNQISTSGWKVTNTRIRLDESRMVRVEVTVADLNP